MSALDTAKELGRMAATATLSKDVIDLFEKKVALLTEQVAALQTENANLKQKVKSLEQELDRFSPKSEELAEIEVSFLQLLAQRNFMSVREIAASLGISKVKAEHHRDVLEKEALIKAPMAGQDAYALAEKGRAYLARRGLI